MRGGAIRLAGRCFGLTVVTGMSAAAGAQQARTGLLVSTGISAESNPFSGQNANGSLAATAEVQPQATFSGENTSISLSGTAQFRRFFRRYGLEDNYSGNASLSTRASERLSLHASLGISYNEGGFNNYGRPGLSPLFATGSGLLETTVGNALPAVSLTEVSLSDQLPLLTDVTVFGLRTRTKSFQSSAGFDARVTGNSRLSGDVNLSASRFKTALLNEYDGAGGELRYARDLNELTSVGVIGSVNLVNYRGTRSGDTVTKSALLSFDRRFGSGWAVSLGAGASFSDVRQLAGQPNASFTSLNVRGRFCRQGQYSSICVSAQRSPQPSANGNVRVSNTIGADYSLRVSERARISLSGAYARTGGWRGTTLSLPAADLATGSARYDVQIRQRTTFFLSGSASRVVSSVASRSANLGLAAGLQFRFGGSR